MKTHWHISMPGGVAALNSVQPTRQEAIERFTRVKRMPWKTLYMRGYRASPGNPLGGLAAAAAGNTGRSTPQD